jgi:hypothetical protein
MCRWMTATSAAPETGRWDRGGGGSGASAAPQGAWMASRGGGLGMLMGGAHEEPVGTAVG